MSISKKQFREICRISVRYSFAYCYLCGAPIAPGESWNLDHVHPKSRGGKSEPGNLRPTHVTCNNAKANMTAAQWFAQGNQGKER
jgi:5-methylcytosine-specific restriction endonuclease McrA